MFSKTMTNAYMNSSFSIENSIKSLDERLNKAIMALREAEHIVIGAGAGLSAAAGLVYDGKVFESRFSDFIAKYHFSNLYTSGFFPFPCEEEKWAYWARHISLCLWEKSAMPLYLQLLEMVKDKDYFVITTNVDEQFAKAGFAPEKIFATQGSYGKLQCATACHDSLYDNQNMVKEMLANTHNCRIPTHLIPRCPVCGGRMETHLRCDQYFVENKDWHDACQRYNSFMSNATNEKTVLLELGIGFNTPGIIRFPFEHLASEHNNITLIRINRDYPSKQLNINHFIPFTEDINGVINEFLAASHLSNKSK